MFSAVLAASFDVMLAVFGVQATVAGTTVEGIFDNAFVLVDVEGEVGAASTAPVLSIKEDSAPYEIGAAVQVDGGSYTVAGIRPDGMGVVRLILEEA
jgi:hypothetical protein